MRIFHFTSGALLAGAAGCSAGAGGAAVQVPTVTVALPAATSLAVTPVPPPAPAIDDYVGRYRISGTRTSDECGNVYLAAHHIQVTPSKELRADVVNRTYTAHAGDTVLSAEGDFDVQTPCGQLHEQWTLARTEDGLAGELVSEWPTPPDCAKTCRVVFAIHAQRVGDRDESQDVPDPHAAP